MKIRKVGILLRFLFVLPLTAAAVFVMGAQKPAAPAPAPAATAAGGDFFIHAFHKKQFDGNLECSFCHVAEKEGSLVLQRPGHDQCMTCHSDAFDKQLNQKICAQCHTAFPPTSSDDLLPFPRYKGSRTILFEFNHSQHVDSQARIDAKTGFRADCTFCHKFDAEGKFAMFPNHDQCAACHSKPGIKPELTPALSAEGCRGCHSPEEIENPNFTEARRFAGPHQTTTGKYVDINFAHATHFRVKEQFGLNCTTCHYAIPNSTNIENLTLPKMIDCVQCHDTARVPAGARMTNCKTCHQDDASSLNAALPTSHTRNVKPDFHTEAFRLHHEEDAAAPGATCFVCHQHVQSSAVASSQCDSCHQIMKPVNHTARWKDDLHGKYAAMDRTTCTVCHTASYCSDCHNELPRSHNPVALWKGGSHAIPAKLDLRGCFTCHTYENTCSECHINKIAINGAMKEPEAAMARATLPRGRSDDLLRSFRNKQVRQLPS